MFSRLITRITVALLRGASLSIQDRTILTGILLDKLNALPIGDIIKVDEKGLRIGGKPISADQAIVLRRSAQRVLDAPAYKVVHDQVAFMAIHMGVHNGDSPEKVFFSRAALWWKQQERELYLAFGDVDDIDDLEEP